MQMPAYFRSKWQIRLILPILLGVSFSASSQTEQYVHRLIGRGYFLWDAAGAWEMDDSVRYTYPGISNTFSYTPITRYHMSIGNSIPVAEPDIPLFETGFYTGDEHYIVTPPNTLYYDSAINYQPVYGFEGQWEMDNYYVRRYQSNRLNVDAFYPSEPYPIDSIVTIYQFSNAGQPVSLTHIGLNYLSNETDTISEYTFFYQDGKPEKVVSLELGGSTYDTAWIKYFTYDAAGTPLTETEYHYYGNGAPTAYCKYNYVFDADNRLTKIERQLQADGVWYPTTTESFGYENGNPSYYLEQTRSMDTTTGLSFTDWDTTYQIFYYHTNQLIDSVVAMSSDHYDNLKRMYKEYYTYADDLLSVYSLYDYTDFTYLTQYMFTYNDLKQLVLEHIEYSDTLYNFYHVIEYHYTYDVYGNMIQKEYATGISNLDIAHVITEPISKTRYTYTQIPIAGTVDGALFLHVYPSPAQSTINLYIGMDAADANDVTLSIFDLAGNIVFNSEIAPTGSTTYAVNCSTWSSGVYTVRIRQGEASAMQKIIVQ